MAGHSKWSNIKFRKAQQDAKKGASFTKIVKEITVAAKLGGDSISTNPRLRVAVQKALSHNLSKDNINKAIKRASSIVNGESLESLIYEGYGPCGSALIIEAFSSNKNRTASDIRSTFTKFNCQLGVSGSVLYLFNHLGMIILKDKISEDDKISLLDYDSVEDIKDVFVEDDHEFTIIYTKPNALYSIDNICSDMGFVSNSTSLYWEAKEKILIEQDIAQFENFLNRLELLDDVQNIYHNINIE